MLHFQISAKLSVFSTHKTGLTLCENNKPQVLGFWSLVRVSRQAKQTPLSSRAEAMLGQNVSSYQNQKDNNQMEWQNIESMFAI